MSLVLCPRVLFKIMADHGCAPVWERDGMMMNVEDLPLSGELKIRLRAWSAWYEHNRSWAGDHSFDYETFAKAGIDLARAVKSELPDWTVMYWDEIAYQRASEGPQEVFEYEVIKRDLSG